jgi:hypothetical protein
MNADQEKLSGDRPKSGTRDRIILGGVLIGGVGGSIVGVLFGIFVNRSGGTDTGPLTVGEWGSLVLLVGSAGVLLGLIVGVLVSLVVSTGFRVRQKFRQPFR